LLGALPIIAKMLGRKLGVEVVIGASQAMTDGNTIYLPPLPLDNPSVAILANGYIDHEAGHVRFSDWTQPLPERPLERSLANLLEDIRIERALGEYYPGTRDNLARLVATLVDQGEFALPPVDVPLAQVVLSYLLHRLRKEVLNQTALAALAEQGEIRIRQSLPPGIVVKLHALAFAVIHTTSTAEVLELAKRIVAMFEEEAETITDNPNQFGPLGESDSGSDQISSTCETDPATSLTSLAAASEVECGTLVDLGRQVAAQLDACAVTGDSRVVMAEYDPIPPRTNATELAHQARAATAALRRRLASLVQASQANDVWRSRYGRRLHGRELYRLAMNDPRLFIHRHERDAPNTVIYLLLDRSGSMRRRIELAAQAALAIAIALEVIPGVAIAVSAFPGSDEDRLLPLVNFGERVTAVAGRFAISADGSTPLQNALWRAGFELVNRREPRRLLLTVTDGEPQNEAASQEVIARCRAIGIEVLGLGIGAQHKVVNLFGSANAMSINDIHHLATALFQLLERRLIYQAA
jgi:Mg-chelatase subunit ChlD